MVEKNGGEGRQDVNDLRFSFRTSTCYSALDADKNPRYDRACPNCNFQIARATSAVGASPSRDITKPQSCWGAAYAALIHFSQYGRGVKVPPLVWGNRCMYTSCSAKCAPGGSPPPTAREAQPCRRAEWRGGSESRCTYSRMRTGSKPAASSTLMHLLATRQAMPDEFQTPPAFVWSSRPRSLLVTGWRSSSASAVKSVEGPSDIIKEGQLRIAGKSLAPSSVAIGISGGTEGGRSNSLDGAPSAEVERAVSSGRDGLATGESLRFHVPVMKEQVVQNLVCDPAGTYLDVTIGGGGHALEILNYLKSQRQVHAPPSPR
eukprot:GHVT01034334.1.p1 GENE.GHVT01034334.1~~GHVT01034334.1.p1  ORF type:complete len:318 (-),score=29.46 GHVT01034334.1:869-1822(-)